MIQKPKILLLSCVDNGVEEDVTLTQYLRSRFDIDHEDVGIVFTHPEKIPNYQMVVLRNVWPIEDNLAALQLLAKTLQRHGIPAYNPLGPEGFRENKNYLLLLTDLGYPVIPTISDKGEIDQLGKPDFYLVKPLHGCSSRGIEKLTYDALMACDIKNQVIEPFIEFEREASFFFIDGQFCHALRTLKKVDYKIESTRWEMELWQPSKAETKWAEQFIRWGALPYGLERVDAGLKSDGEMLLLEIENLAPFLSLGILPTAAKELFLDRLAASIEKHCLNPLPASALKK